MVETYNQIDILKAKSFDNLDFEDVVNVFKDRVINICYSYVRKTVDAEDIAQEVFIEVFKSMDKFRGQSTLSTWIFRIASNKSLDYIRSNNRIKRGKNNVTYLEDSEYWKENVNAVTSADEEIIDAQRRELFYNALSKLNSKQQEVYVLTQIEGMSQQEVADILKTTIKSVESMVVRARKKLRKVLEKHIKDYL